MKNFFRMQRLFLNKMINVLAVDHGLANGVINGLEDPVCFIEKMCKIGCKNVLLNKGIAFEIANNGIDLNGANILVNLSSGLNFNNLKLSKTVYTSLEMAIKLDAVAVAIQIDFSSELSMKSLVDLGAIIDEAYKWGMPVLAMVYVKQGFEFNIQDAVRIVEEMGVDMIKIAKPKLEQEKSILTHAKIPILLAGGECRISSEFEADINSAFCLGYKGLVVGRNIFQGNNPEQTIRWLNNIAENKKCLEKQ